MRGEIGRKEATVPVEVRWKGGSVVEAKIRKFRLLMDTPPHEKQEGEKSKGPSATETFLAALGRCILISILKATKETEVDVKGLSAKVEGKLCENEFEIWTFKDIIVNVEIDTKDGKREVGRLLRLSHKYCTVGNTIKDRVIPSIRLVTKCS